MNLVVILNSFRVLAEPHCFRLHRLEPDDANIYAQRWSCYQDQGSTEEASSEMAVGQPKGGIRSGLGFREFGWVGSKFFDSKTVSLMLSISRWQVSNEYNCWLWLQKQSISVCCIVFRSHYVRFFNLQSPKHPKGTAYIRDVVVSILLSKRIGMGCI